MTRQTRGRDDASSSPAAGPFRGMLDRSVERGLDVHLTRGAGILERCVDFGTRLLVRCTEIPVAKVDATLFVERQVIEFADAASVLLRRKCVDPCKPLVRGQIEAVMALAYIAQRDSARRSIQYAVAHYHARIDEHERQDESTLKGKAFRADLEKDEVFRGMRFEPYASADAIADLRGVLARPELAEVEAEWQRSHAERKARRKAGGGSAKLYWYSLFDGPRTVQNLARSLAKGGWYEGVYRAYSGDTHADAAMQHIHTATDGSLILKPLRHPVDLVTIVNLATVLCLESFRHMESIHGLDPAAPDSWARWYLNHLQQDFQQIGRLEIKLPG